MYQYHSTYTDSSYDLEIWIFLSFHRYQLSTFFYYFFNHPFNVAEKENEGQQLKPEAEDVRNRQAQYPENAPPQIRSPADSIVANHVIIGRPGLYAKEETRSKGLKI